MFKVKIQGSKVERIRPYHGCSISNITDFTYVSNPFLSLSMISKICLLEKKLSKYECETGGNRIFSPLGID